MSEKNSDHQDGIKSASERFLDATTRTFHMATSRAGQYKDIVQKKIDVTALHRKINHAHHDLGQMIDDLSSRGVKRILEHHDVREALGKLSEMRTEMVNLEQEIDHLRHEPDTQETTDNEPPQKH